LPAVSKMNDDFNLGLVLNRKMTIREREKMRENTENRRLLHVEKERRRTAYMDRKNALLDEWSRLDNNRRDFAPQSMDDDFHPLYAEAVRKIDAVELSLLEMMEETV
ncbi:MAG: hypothetical protein RSC29_05465, partial [Oscillospiraceae bacterium]